VRDFKLCNLADTNIVWDPSVSILEESLPPGPTPWRQMKWLLKTWVPNSPCQWKVWD